jgi:hypothetical protein
MTNFNETFKHLNGSDANEEIRTIMQVVQGPCNSILYFESDVTLDENLDFDFIENFCSTEGIEFQFIVVNGNLTVNGRINLPEEHPGLIVTGFTKAHTLEGSDCEIYIQDGEFDYFVHGDYASGILEAGTVKTQFVINTDHHLVINSSTAIFINNGSQVVDDYPYVYSRSDFPSTFVEEVLSGNHLDMDKFYVLLKDNKNVFRSDANRLNNE